MNVATLVLIAVSNCAAAAQIRVTVHVYNSAPESAQVLQRAQKETSWIVGKSGFTVEWVNCKEAKSTAARQHLCDESFDPLSFVIGICRADCTGTAASTALGASVIGAGRGNHGVVLYSRILSTVEANRDLIDTKTLLAYVLAHEIGHLLLGSAGHGEGIMKTDWQQRDFSKMRQRQLVFTREQTEKLQAALQRRAVKMYQADDSALMLPRP